MNPLDWPDHVPARLRQRAEELVATRGSPDHEGLISAAVEVTRRIVRDQAAGRGAALDLLAADALVTHALAGSAGASQDFETGCLSAMHEIASIIEAP